MNRVFSANEVFDENDDGVYNDAYDDFCVDNEDCAQRVNASPDDDVDLLNAHEYVPQLRIH